MSFTDSLFVCLQIFVTDISHGLTQGDEFWQDGRPGWVAGHLLTSGTLTGGLRVHHLSIG